MTTSQNTFPKLPMPVWLTALTAFLIPFWGGQISTEATPLAPGFGAILSSFMGGNEATLWAHAFLCLPVLAGFVYLSLTRKIFQTPITPLVVSVMIYLGLVILSVSISSYRSHSLTVAMEFALQGLVFFAVVAGVGRQKGPHAVLTALFVATVILGCLGLREYGEFKADPTWRIFAGWSGPNALAGMLLIGFFVGIGLLWVSERVQAILIGLGLVIVGFALGLTQSKGGLLSLIVIFPILLIAGVVLRGERPLREILGRPILVLALVAALIFGVQMQAKKQGATSGVASRVTDFSSTAEQSAGFRTNLWKGAVELVKQNPVGIGIGSYRFESARSGLTTQTVLAHQSFLQLAVEISPAGLLAFLGMISLWLWHMVRNSRKLPSHQNLLRLGAVAAVGVILAHSMTESVIYYFGLGLSLWLLLGLTVLMASDSVSPEFVFPQLRWIACGVVAVALGAMLFLGNVEISRNHFSYDLGKKDFSAIKDSRDAVAVFAAFDADSKYLIVSTSEGYSRQLVQIKEARPAEFEKANTALGPLLLPDNKRLEESEALVRLAPTTRNLRLLAKVRRSLGDKPGGSGALAEALRHDPTNLNTLNQMLSDAIEDKDDVDIREIANKLISAEEKVSFKVRSLPEMVPTETYHARWVLAQLETDKRKAIELLLPAVEGFRQYAKRTIPQVRQMTTAGMSYAGEDMAKARAKMEEATTIATSLAKLQRELGFGAADAEEAAAFFAGVFKDDK